MSVSAQGLVSVQLWRVSDPFGLEQVGDWLATAVVLFRFEGCGFRFGGSGFGLAACHCVLRERSGVTTLGRGGGSISTPTGLGIE